MALRLFGGGSSRRRTCPACEALIAAEASFCPSCYMVFRPEGAEALRKHLGGERIPSHVYLLRKMQSQDPDAGPVVRRPTEPASPAAVTADLDLPADPPPAPADPPPAAMTELDASADPEEVDVPPAAERPRGDAPSPSSPAGSWLETLFTFESPLPPPTRTAAEAPRLLAWMLEHDRFIPNNLARLEAIHAGEWAGGPAGRLDYQAHLLLQIADDLWLCSTQPALEAHLARLVEAYRQAAEAYQSRAGGDGPGADGLLWQMASAASRLRVEGWIYRNLFGRSPHFAAAGGRRRTPRGPRR